MYFGQAMLIRTMNAFFHHLGYSTRYDPTTDTYEVGTVQAEGAVSAYEADPEAVHMSLLSTRSVDMMGDENSTPNNHNNSKYGAAGDTHSIGGITTSADPLIVTAADLELVATLDPRLGPGRAQILAEGINKLLSTGTQIVVGVDGDLVAQGAQLVIKRLIKGADGESTMCVVAVLDVFKDTCNMNQEEFQLGGAMLGNDFNRRPAGMGPMTVLEALLRGCNPERFNESIPPCRRGGSLVEFLADLKKVMEAPGFRPLSNPLAAISEAEFTNKEGLVKSLLHGVVGVSNALVTDKKPVQQFGILVL